MGRESCQGLGLPVFCSQGLPRHRCDSSQNLRTRLFRLGRGVSTTHTSRTAARRLPDQNTVRSLYLGSVQNLGGHGFSSFPPGTMYTELAADLVYSRLPKRQSYPWVRKQ